MRALERGGSRRTGGEADPFLSATSIEVSLEWGAPLGGASQNAHLGAPEAPLGGAKRRQEGGSRQTAPRAEPFLRNTTSRGVSQIGGFKANGRPNGALSGKQHPGAASQNAHLRHTPSPSYHPLPTIPFLPSPSPEKFSRAFESFLRALESFLELFESF